ncbi:sulfite exporter TauE/SafE family protein [Rhodohalobacter barkolensis]|uniref:Probable membrane transporter protein n=1 Tax=Rhodohalobacter barkolensis TaxID=2053187 RepID=A0A2N0VLX5_9BACT|nr:sulfite exporter TauE/SafE family protein [Rhodohalobacter barkolensis]PKD45203.1 sulfite exporter TauE/SafE family protein [Rhodohalobacter barkolensis]
MFILLLLLGLVAGVMAGFFGVGGGLLFSPILFFLFTSLGVSSPVSWTVGSSLFCTFTAAVSSSIQQKNNKNSYWREGIIIGLFGSLGVYFGKEIVTSSYYTEDVFVSFFVILLVFVSILFYRRSKSNVTLQLKAKKTGWLKQLGAGGLGGLIAALAGVGGGIVLVPIMNLWYRLSIAKAVSISSLAIVLISLSGWLQYALASNAPEGITSFTLGYVDFGTSLPLVMGAFVGGFFGVKLNKKASADRVQLGFSILVIAIAISMIAKLI